MENVQLFKGIATPTSSNLPKGGIYFNTSTKDIYLNNNGNIITYKGNYDSQLAAKADVDHQHSVNESWMANLNSSVINIGPYDTCYPNMTIEQAINKLSDITIAGNTIVADKSWSMAGAVEFDSKSLDEDIKVVISNTPPASHNHNILKTSDDRNSLTLESNGNITLKGYNPTSENDRNRNSGSNTIIFGDSNVNDTLNEDNDIPNTTSPDVTAKSNFICGSSNFCSGGNNLIAGCWNKSQDDGHNNIIGGFSNSTTSRNNIIAGSNHEVYAPYCFVAGNNNTVHSTGQGYSAIIGYDHDVYSKASLVVGYGNTVGEKQSISQTVGGNFCAGRGNLVDGQASNALGQANQVAHNFATAIGRSLITHGDCHVVVGKYNAGGTSNDIFEVGTGKDGSRRTAFKVRSYDTYDIINMTGEINMNCSSRAICIGNGLTNVLSDQILLGHFNNTSQSGENAVLVVGCGTNASDRKTAFKVRDNGNTEFYHNIRLRNSNAAIYAANTDGSKSSYMKYNCIYTPELDADHIIAPRYESLLWSGNKLITQDSSGMTAVTVDDIANSYILSNYVYSFEISLNGSRIQLPFIGFDASVITQGHLTGATIGVPSFYLSNLKNVHIYIQPCAKSWVSGTMSGLYFNMSYTVEGTGYGSSVYLKKIWRKEI